MDKINKINKITFKTKNTFEDRRNEADKINTKYPQRGPIIVEKCDKCTLIYIDKNKFLVPRDLNMNQFVYIIRKRIKLDKSQSIFLMVNGSLCPSNTPISVIYEDHKDKDGFLYIKYASENTFG
jgi:GABA(A) receptor-associated protein